MVDAADTSDEFVSFLDHIVTSQPRDREIHIIADHLSAHETAKVMALLEGASERRLHYTPTYASWLNQVELWFAKALRLFLTMREVNLFAVGSRAWRVVLVLLVAVAGTGACRSPQQQWTG